jgi:hypothetical protein
MKKILLLSLKKIIERVLIFGTLKVLQNTFKKYSKEKVRNYFENMNQKSIPAKKYFYFQKLFSSNKS